MTAATTTRAARVIIALTAQALAGYIALPAENIPPQVSLSWPAEGDEFTSDVFVKVKAEATDSDGSIAQVQFFANTNLVGVVTNPPFSIIWQIFSLPPNGNGWWHLKAVATDNLGATTESVSVAVYVLTGRPPFPTVGIASPRRGELFAAPASFLFSAELLAAATPRLGPVEFFVNTNSVGVVTQTGTFTASTPLYTTPVTNLTEGDYELSVKFYGDGGYCYCWPETIHVVKLGVQFPRVTEGGQLQFEVVSSFPKKPTVIEMSSDLQGWGALATNPPAGNAFIFTDPSPPTNSLRFYRAVVAP